MDIYINKRKFIIWTLISSFCAIIVGIYLIYNWVVFDTTAQHKILWFNSFSNVPFVRFLLAIIGYGIILLVIIILPRSYMKYVFSKKPYIKITPSGLTSPLNKNNELISWKEIDHIYVDCTHIKILFDIAIEYKSLRIIYRDGKNSSADGKVNKNPSSLWLSHLNVSSEKILSEISKYKLIDGINRDIL